MSARHLQWGLAAATLYVAAGLIPASLGVPVLPVFDGLAPPEPYRWVSPPLDTPEVPGIEEPLTGEETIPVDEHFGAFAVITPDGQAQFSLLADAVELPPGEEAIAMTLTPLDPESLAPPPGGLRFDSNAYRGEAEYVPSGDPVTITEEATVLLRYSIHAEDILRWDGTEWQPLETTVLQGTLQVFTNTPELGAFVAVGPQFEETGPGWQLWVGVVAGAAALLIGLEVFLRRRRSRARRGKTKPRKKAGTPDGKKPKAGKGKKGR
jgi:hypothetical protein